ncbi:DUF2442 domain-containing protein [uncultured Pseudacidovorax sp.]|uniref:DUF2442 domain-containing protein n=1 Tax=uncultured Pseudacidovorax sp. TaxID=679313 RepID=UPI0025DCDF3C|nr:DUF2442 domain-containing protein [uncultured Pseudacidovorax sp.]
MTNALTLTAVKADRDGRTLHLEFADGAAFTVDLQPVIRRHSSLRPLADAATFRRAKLGPWGATVTWGADELELAADNLRARAVEQAGGVSHERIIEWMSRHGMTLESAADALGLSRRMLAYYRSGEREIPRTVDLACTGWDALHQRKAA